MSDEIPNSDDDIAIEDMMPSENTLKSFIDKYTTNGCFPTDDLESIKLSLGYTLSIYNPNPSSKEENCTGLTLFSGDGFSAIALVLNEKGLRHLAKSFTEHADLLSNSVKVH